MISRTILVVDDEEHIRQGLCDALSAEGYEGIEAVDGKNALEVLNKTPVDMVITDLRMPKMDGNELLKKIYSSYPTIPVVVLTGHGTIEEAVNAMQNGAVDFLTKPVDLGHLFMIINRTLQNKDIVARNTELEKELQSIKEKNSFTRIVGNSQSVNRLLDTIQRVASTKASVLITGESGVGKELVADSIVNFSSRKDKPFVKVHCAALNENLLESELFGHVKGAFTGAVSDKRGRFEMADGGTLFLDEIGEISQSTQIKLLRVLQEREFERVGSEKTIKTDVRIIAATNRNLEEEIKAGRFREDLYYRLNVVRLEVPPLRTRKEDIFLLCRDFLDTFNEENGKHVEGFSTEAKTAILSYDWPGNIRELRNCVESAVVMCRGSIIGIEDLPPQVSKCRAINELTIPIGSTMEEIKKTVIEQTISYCNGNKTKAAQMLDIGRKTIFRQINDSE